MQYAITQNEPVEQRRSRVESDQCEKRFGAELVSFHEDVANFVVLRKQRRHFPGEKIEPRTAEQNLAKTG